MKARSHAASSSGAGEGRGCVLSEECASRFPCGARGRAASPLPTPSSRRWSISWHPDAVTQLRGGCRGWLLTPRNSFCPCKPGISLPKFPHHFCPWQTHCFFFLLCRVWFKLNLFSEIILCHQPLQGLEEHPSGGAGRSCVLWSGCEAFGSWKK